MIAPGIALIIVKSPKIMDIAKALFALIPPYAKRATIPVSLTPQPARDMGKTENNKMGGIRIKKSNKNGFSPMLSAIS